jgi:hypothetical protein
MVLRKYKKVQISNLKYLRIINQHLQVAFITGLPLIFFFPLSQVGARVAVHYDVKFRNVTFITSRQGVGVTGGNPVGFK